MHYGKCFIGCIPHVSPKRISDKKIDNYEILFYISRNAQMQIYC